MRENSNIIVLFPPDAKNVNHVHADHCSDISINENENEIKLRVIIHKGDIAIVIRYTSLKITLNYRERWGKGSSEGGRMPRRGVD